MKDENTMYKNVYLRKLNEDIEMGADPALGEPAAEDMPPVNGMGAGEEGEPATAIDDAGEGMSSEMGGKAFNDLRSYMDTLPQDGQVSNQQIIDLGKKYADYFREVKDTIKELQEKQLSNAFEDCLNVKFLPLSKALSNMIDELDAGVADKVHEKNMKAEKDQGVDLGV